MIKVKKEFEEQYKRYAKTLDDREKRNLKPISFDEWLWRETEKRVKV